MTPLSSPFDTPRMRLTSPPGVARAGEALATWIAKGVLAKNQRRAAEAAEAAESKASAGTGPVPAPLPLPLPVPASIVPPVLATSSTSLTSNTVTGSVVEKKGHIREGEEEEDR